MITDSIGNYFTRIRNSFIMGHRIVNVPSSKLKKSITKILYDQGYILNYKFIDISPQGIIKIALKYDKISGISVIKCIKRISKPGLRKYFSSSKIPRVLNGLGISIISTSKGIMTGNKAKRMNIGGEILCYIY